MRSDLSSCRAQQLDCTPLLPPLTKIYLATRQVPPALGLAVIIDAVLLFSFSSFYWALHLSEFRRILLILYCWKEKEQQQQRVQGCSTQVQNSLECIGSCVLGHCFLPPHKKTLKHSLFIFGKKIKKNHWRNNVSNHRMKEQPMQSIRAELLDHNISKCPGEQKTCEMKI